MNGIAFWETVVHVREIGTWWVEATRLRSRTFSIKPLKLDSSKKDVDISLSRSLWDKVFTLTNEENP